jgi:hypothetical protein
MLDAIEVHISDLILDPNNPRFVSSLDDAPVIPDSELVASETSTLEKFSLNATNDDEDVTNVKNLYESMLKIGFVPIDRVVVRRIEGTKKFLVIEGNRRISTVKLILKLLDPSADIQDKVRRQLEEHKPSFEKIPCKLMETDGLSKEEIEHRISVILGIRHHGSLLEWEPLPRAYSIYKEYKTLQGNGEDDFKLDNKIVTEVSARLSISAAEVKGALKTYIAYLQLGEVDSSVKSKHYSLIQAAVGNRTLASYYFKIDGSSFLLTDESVGKLIQLCQFDTRDSNDGQKKIIPTPQDMSKFGRLVKTKVEEHHEEAKKFIETQILQVLDEESGVSVDEALDTVTSYINRKQWVEAVMDLLAAQKEKLAVEDYTGMSNDLAAKDEVKATLKKIRRALAFEG